MTPIESLREAVANAEEVLGCGNNPCCFKEPTGQCTQGRCRCVDQPLAAVFKAAKAVVEEPTRKACDMCGSIECARALTTDVPCARIIVCRFCWYPNCPRAANHDNVCTGSNEPGQVGSTT